MNQPPFNAVLEIEEIQQKRKERRKKQYRPSQLKKYRAEIVEFINNGASYRMIAEWLLSKKHLNVSHSTVMRFAKSLPELQENPHAELP
jgi:IS30 family transposase